MRFGITIMLLLLFSTSLFSQKGFFGQKDSTFFFNEFTVSINRTAVKDNNTENRFGFGAGIYHSSSDKKMVNFVFGFEYNRTSQFKYGMSDGRFVGAIDVDYFINSASIPLDVRINFGKKTKVFLEAGMFLDINSKAKRKGTKRVFSTETLEYSEYYFSDERSVKGTNYGPSIGAGLKIPVAYHAIILKADYKHGVKDLSESYNEILNSYFRFMLGFKL